MCRISLSKDYIKYKNVAKETYGRRVLTVKDFMKATINKCKTGNKSNLARHIRITCKKNIIISYNSDGYVM